ncbi:MAG: ABC transporter transmembrane domain-containing protein, partial [Anaerolineae bacterium]|nr:ABC transporter transmembrane domain-containing protein [Anaerolineae bacterium]
MMGMDGGRRIFERETVKPKNLSATLGRFATYFKRYWYALVLVLFLTIFNTWTQVYAPKLTGQAIDCYIFNAAELAQTQAFLSGADAGDAVVDSCWYTDDDAGTITARINADDSIAQDDKASAITSAKIAGLGQLVLLLVGLFIVGAVINGIAFFMMSWTGHNVLRAIRKDLFRHMNRLSLSFYNKNEAGDIMSRITNDTDTIQQVFSFALLSV